jgi:hypothetical protein
MSRCCVPHAGDFSKVTGPDGRTGAPVSSADPPSQSDDLGDLPDAERLDDSALHRRGLSVHQPNGAPTTVRNGAIASLICVLAADGKVRIARVAAVAEDARGVAAVAAREGDITTPPALPDREVDGDQPGAAGRGQRSNNDRRQDGLREAVPPRLREELAKLDRRRNEARPGPRQQERHRRT